MSLVIPSDLDWWRSRPDGAAWLSALPEIVGTCVERWGLRLGEPFEGGNASLVAPGELPDGTEAVLKVSFPDEESAREPDALAFWNGKAVVRLLDSDPSRRALLIERCRPGTQLWTVEDDEEATRIAAGVLRRLWRPIAPGHLFRLLSDVAKQWNAELLGSHSALGGPFDRKLLDEALVALAELGPSQGEQVLLHQDFHGGNVLLSGEGNWLAIDPKPLVGEREFDLASLLRDRRWALVREDGARIVQRRLDILTDELGLDRERMRLWGIAHALAWGMSSGGVHQEMIHAARLLQQAS